MTLACDIDAMLNRCLFESVHFHRCLMNHPNDGIASLACSIKGMGSGACHDVFFLSNKTHRPSLFEFEGRDQIGILDAAEAVIPSFSMGSSLLDWASD